ncbi:ubiquitin-like-specific protease 1D isoform X2 [Malania oleifera]|uniref:ubiquitin-like-specific protease 1D isoform X2 n=1 Tax=Malania oleifera TaxID=397392 RepID=UPI0025AE358A|nr:ubiquitin-like-specific protease 1D isoform X2 [Malania oleifera]
MSCMEGEEEKKKKPLDLDWDQLLPTREDEEPPAELVVTTEATAGAVTASGAATTTSERQRHREHSPMVREPQAQQQHYSQRDDIEHMTDHELNDTIRRKIRNIETLGPKLPDKGAKLRASLKRFQGEMERRNLQRLQPDANGCEMLIQSEISNLVGAFNGFRQEVPSSKAQSQSTFASLFHKKLDENETDCRTVNAFDKELSFLGRCNRRKSRLNGECSQRQRQRTRDRKGGAPSLSPAVENLTISLPKKRIASEELPSNDSRPQKAQTVVLVDEEEPQLAETIRQAEKLSECLKEKIYYPSRDDPESVEICYSDIRCVAPEAYLSSTIMNFYIRYLQQLASPTERARCDYHFFNTYFYKKLKEAVSRKIDKETFFIKFRRWWKGVNIFQKAYILIPIHEDLHWSLVIICIPDKEDESGPIILHLDSLRLHCSKSVFGNIKSYLREEWNYLNQDVAPPDVPIAERIWKHLPRRIDGKIIAVPQQKNEYDCGLFVLFFMERFIEEAPERLRKNDLAMFGKQWFKPEEASGLRGKIRKLLIEEFQRAREHYCVQECTSLSPGMAPAGSGEHHHDS